MSTSGDGRAAADEAQYTAQASLAETDGTFSSVVARVIEDGAARADALATLRTEISDMLHALGPHAETAPGQAVMRRIITAGIEQLSTHLLDADAASRAGAAELLRIASQGR